MMSRKGITTTLLAVIIVAIVVGVLIISVFAPIAEAVGGPGISQSLTDLCRFNMHVKNQAPVGTKWAVVNLFCHAQSLDIDAGAWKKCDPDEALSLKKNKDKFNCAKIQIAQLAKTCFYMYGEDTWKLSAHETGKYPCFSFAIKGLANREFSELDFTKGMDTLGYCTEASRFNNKYCGGSGTITDPWGSCPIYCGNSENVVWRGNVHTKDNGPISLIWPNVVRSKYNVMCFDERASWEDAVLINDFGCDLGNLPADSVEVISTFASRAKATEDSETEVTISASDWSACDPDGSYGWKPSSQLRAQSSMPQLVGETTPVASNTQAADEGDRVSCGAAQLANLAADCWLTYGAGAEDNARAHSNHACFKAKIENIGDLKITEADITRVMEQTNLCSTLENNECTDPGACQPRCGYSNQLWLKGLVAPEIKDGDAWHVAYLLATPADSSTAQIGLIFDTEELVMSFLNPTT